MFEMTTLRFWIGMTAAWLILCVLLFDQWFFFSPLGLMVTFGIPLAGWFVWWRYSPAEGHEISDEERQLIDKSQALLQRLKSRFIREQ